MTGTDGRYERMTERYGRVGHGVLEVQAREVCVDGQVTMASSFVICRVRDAYIS